MIPEERFQEAIKRWTALIEEYPQLSRAIRVVDAASLKMGSIMCPECALHCSRRSVHNHMNSTVCVQRRETIRAVMEGYVEWYGATNSAFPYIEPFIVRITTDSFSTEARWVPQWWYDLWHLYKRDDCDEIFTELARAYGANDTEEVQRIIGLIELSLAG